jgi:predicted phosphodiesterase
MAQCNLDNKTLIITEGQIDSLSVAEAGIDNAVSVPTGAKGFTWIPHCWDWIQNFDKIVVFGDHENGYITLYNDLAARFDSKVWHVREEDYKDCKDANDILRKYGVEQIRQCIANAEQKPIDKVIDITMVEDINPYDIEKMPTGIKDIDESRLTDGNKAFLCVKGNCDLCVSAVYPYPEELLICISEYTVIMVHGHLNGVKSGLEKLLVYADKRGANVVLFGHTHTPFEAYFPAGTRIDGHTLTRDMWMFNPGSIGSRSYGLMQIQNGQILFSHGRI